MKGNGKSRVFYRAGEWNINTVINLLGDRPIDEYSETSTNLFFQYIYYPYLFL